jgi:hypothetical protein
MSTQTDFYEDTALLERLVHGYEHREEFVFLFGSGLTCPAGDVGGVSNVNQIVELVREEFSKDLGALKQLEEKICESPTDSYQIAFQHLVGRRPPGIANQIIRKAVLAARLPSAPHQREAHLLSTENYREAEECEELCKVLEDDLEHWHMRPGLKCLGHVLTEFHESFGGEVITTNFDPLIEVSINRASGKAWAKPLPGDAPSDWPPKPEDGCHVLHIHGYWSGVDTLNTRGALENERPNLDRELGKILRKRVLVVIGYGGWDDAFTRALSYANQDPRAQTNILWAFYPSNEQHIHSQYRYLLKSLLEGLGRTRVFFYKGVDADKFFPELLKRLHHVSNPQASDLSAAEPSGDESAPDALKPLASEKAARRAIFSPPVMTSTAESLVRDHESLVRDQTLSFVSALRERGASLVAVDDFLASKQPIQEPKFLLFERQGAKVMAVVPSQSSVDEYRLQKTTDPQVKGEMLSQEQVVELGFTVGRVHPMFKDERRVIQRIFWDSSLLTQAILFPESQMALPVYHREGTEQKVLASIAVVLELLTELHGPEKIVFASIATRGGAGENNLALQALIADAPFVTRYAPTPSGHLHLGNARTALATYLLSLSCNTQARFFLRVDNTDHERSRSHFVDQIKDDLEWLGLQWNKGQDTFQQSDKAAFNTYRRLLSVLEMAGLTEVDEDGTIHLKSLPSEFYYCLHYNWRLGAIITHHPPLTKERSERKLNLFRANDDNAYYRFAGLIDDVRRLSDRKHLTFVIRDTRQAFFTQEQAHIRYALELARQKLQSHPEAQRLFQESGIDPQTSIPVPVYLLVPYVTDNGEVAAAGSHVETEPGTRVRKPKYTVLHKRRADESELLERYTLSDLKQRQRLLPESIVSYLVATILPYSRASMGWKEHLNGIALIFSHLGVQASLQFFSQQFTLNDLVRRQPPIHCNLDDIRFAERIIIRALPFWKVKQKLDDEIDGIGDLDDNLIKRISDHSTEFVSFAQILGVARRPHSIKPLSPATMKLLAHADSKARNAAEFVKIVKAEVTQVWRNAQTLSAPSRKERYADLSLLLADLREALTATETSPKIELLLTILGDAETEARLRKPSNWRRP